MAEDKKTGDNKETSTKPESGAGLDRRKFLGAVTAGAGAAAVASTLTAGAKPAEAEMLFPKERGTFGGGGSEGGGVYRSENDLYDCEVEGNIPTDLEGIFFRVGPDPQYPKPERNEHDIGFDGEGHVSSFRIKDGHVDYKTRYVHTQRWKAQHEARRSLFGMYRNPMTDDPSVKGLSRGTANTQQFFHHGKLLVLKEDSPPVTMDPYTLETTDDYYLFGGGKYPALTHTAHPKIDSDNGDLISFGYEAKGFATDDIYVFQADAKDGHIKWDAWIKAPYIGMIHDFAATDTHIIFLACPLAIAMEQMKKGGVHWAWDSTMPTLIGVMHRGGDGKDIRWFKGPQTMCTHVMGCWSDGEKITMDMDGGDGNQFAFFPNVHNDYDPKKAFGTVRRFKIDFANKSKDTYDMEIMYPQGVALSRQDDRYHTKPYRWGFAMAYGQKSGWGIFDQTKKEAKVFSLDGMRLNEPVFVPRKEGAAEGDGYLIGVGSDIKEGGRADLVLLDLDHVDDGPIARVKMPYRIVGQVHGYWTPGYQLPPMKA